MRKRLYMLILLAFICISGCNPQNLRDIYTAMDDSNSGDVRRAYICAVASRELLETRGYNSPIVRWLYVEAAIANGTPHDALEIGNLLLEQYPNDSYTIALIDQLYLETNHRSNQTLKADKCPMNSQKSNDKHKAQRERKMSRNLGFLKTELVSKTP